MDGHHLLSLRRFFGSNADKICASGARGFQMDKIGAQHHNPIVKPDVKLEVDPGTGPGGQPSPIQPTRKSNTKPNPKSNPKFPPKVESKVSPEPEFEPEVVQDEPEAEPKFGCIKVEKPNQSFDVPPPPTARSTGLDTLKIQKGRIQTRKRNQT